MSTAVDATIIPERRRMSRQQAVWLVVACTLISATAQILIKVGANKVAGINPFAMLTNIPLLAGYSLYGVFTFLFIFALRDEELSFVYPIISLGYVWVAAFSAWFLHEVVNGWKLAGIATIVAGVAVLGKDARR